MEPTAHLTAFGEIACDSCASESTPLPRGPASASCDFCRIPLPVPEVWAILQLLARHLRYVGFDARLRANPSPSFTLAYRPPYLLTVTAERGGFVLAVQGSSGDFLRRTSPDAHEVAEICHRLERRFGRAARIGLHETREALWRPPYYL